MEKRLFPGLASAQNTSVLPTDTHSSPTSPRTFRPMTSQTIHIACLCATWCRQCENYALVLEREVADLASKGTALRMHWIDIEDEVELVGDVDVETFPTIVIADHDNVRFAGPLTPHSETLRRLLRATVLNAPPDARWPAVGFAMEAFAERLRTC